MSRKYSTVEHGLAPQRVRSHKEPGGAPAIGAGESRALGEVCGVEVTQHRIHTRRIDAAAHDVHRSWQLQERPAMAPRPVLIN